jgi:hypothetical protein
VNFRNIFLVTVLVGSTAIALGSRALQVESVEAGQPAATTPQPF